MPKLAKFLAKLNYKYGLYPTPHTQNLLAVLNFETGDIEQFSFRDGADVSFDPFIRYIQNKKPLWTQSDGIYNLLGNASTTVAHASEVPNPGSINGGQIGYWNLHHITADPKFNKKLKREFLYAYIDQVQKVLKLSLSPIPSNVIEQSLNETYTPGSATFLALYDQVIDHYTGAWPNRSQRFDQKLLYDALLAHYFKTQYFAFLRDNPVHQYSQNGDKLRQGAAQLLRFSLYQGKILSFRTDNGKLTGFEYGLTRQQIAECKKLLIKR